MPSHSSGLRALFIALLLVSFLGLPCHAGSMEAPNRHELISNQDENWEGDYLYKVAILRAAPGRLLALIELMKEERDLPGEPRRLVARRWPSGTGCGSRRAR